MLCIGEYGVGSIPSDVDVVVSPTFVHIQAVKDTLSGPYQIAAQNCWTGKGGAFTGEVSAEMLKDMGIPWVILGHSERRALCGEANDVVGTKVEYALSQGLKIIACIGETLTQRENGEMFDVLGSQLEPIMKAVDNWDNIVIAYEPVWAIGTGVVATPDQAQEAHAFVRQWLTDKIGKDVAEKTRILYGGSVNDGNCEELAKQEDVDGFLVGGASLKGPSFVKICNANNTAATKA